jgi:4-amino-4-deoxy-L-arabinose transferase-like glycosyltransferase
VKKLFFLPLAGIFLLGLFLRLFSLSAYPAGFTPDEAAFGYNAYSLLKTGRDEWGTAFFNLPVTGLRSFGDYKLPLYAFFSVPPVSLFGLNEFSTRLPNAVLSSLAVVLFYILALRFTRSRLLAHLAALFLAVSPWIVPLSRGAFEANLTVVFLILALSLLVSKKFIQSALIFALGMYSYHTGRLILPVIFLAGLFLLFPVAKRLRSGLVFLLLALPALFSLVAFNARSADISIFNPADGWASMANGRLALINSGVPQPLARLLVNKLTSTGQIFIANYFSYFSPRFLFSSGPAEATYGMLPGRGVMTAVDLIFLPFGLVYFFRRRSRFAWLLLITLLISPFPAALTKGAGFAANRAAPLVVPLLLISAAGAWEIFYRSRTRRLPVVLLTLFLVISAANISNYRQVIPNLSAKSMGYGWKTAISPIFSATEYFSEVRISRALSEPHIYLAFYARLDPVFYQLSSASWADFQSRGFRFLDQYDGYWLGSFRFGDLNFDRPVSFPVLYIGRPQDFPTGTDYKILSVYPDGQPAIVSVVKTGMDNLTFRI